MRRVIPVGLLLCCTTPAWAQTLDCSVVSLNGRPDDSGWGYNVQIQGGYVLRLTERPSDGEPETTRLVPLRDGMSTANESYDTGPMTDDIAVFTLASLRPSQQVLIERWRWKKNQTADTFHILLHCPAAP